MYQSRFWHIFDRLLISAEVPIRTIVGFHSHDDDNDGINGVETAAQSDIHDPEIQATTLFQKRAASRIS